MNQLWRRNIKKADKLGVEVSLGTPEDLKAFHALYVETAERDHFTPRPLPYFTKMHAALSEQPHECCDFRLYNAYHEGDLVASTIWIRVGGIPGTRTARVRPPNETSVARMRFSGG